VVLKVRERLAVSKRGTEKFDRDKFNLKKLNDLEGKGQHQVKFLNRFSALENVDDIDISSSCEAIKENIQIRAKGSLCYYELKQRKI
jgi:hypothetical protein